MFSYKKKTTEEKIAILVTRVTCWSWSDPVDTNRHTVLCYVTEIYVARRGGRALNSGLTQCT